MNTLQTRYLRSQISPPSHSHDPLKGKELFQDINKDIYLATKGHTVIPCYQDFLVSVYKTLHMKAMNLMNMNGKTINFTIHDLL